MIHLRARDVYLSLLAVFLYGVFRILLVDPRQFFTYDTLIIVELLLKMAAFLLAFATLRGIPQVTRIAEPVCDEYTDVDTAPAGWSAFLAGLAFFGCVIWYLEKQQPFFFTQDDNLAQFLPVMAQAGRDSLHGVVSTWNPYQLRGFPTLTLGVYALTYPVTYLSYLFSRFALGDENKMIEVFCIAHLAAGYVAQYWAAREYRVRPWIAAAAAASASLSGWALIASRSWYYVCEIFVYVPLIIVATRRLQRGGTGWRWTILTGLTFGAFFHAGNAQFWVYALIFFWIAVAMLWWAAEIDWAAVLRAASATMIGIGISAPLLLLQMAQTHGVRRKMNIYAGELTGEWLAYLLPGPWVHDYRPGAWIDKSWITGGLIVYSGTTFLAMAIVLGLAMLALRGSRKRFAANVWLFCALLSFLCGIGREGVLWPLMGKLPLFNAFRLPFKFVAFLDIFAILAGAIACERILRRIPRPRLAQVAIATITFTMVAVGCSFPLPAWYIYGMKPYPEPSLITRQIPEVMNNQYRLLSLAPFRSRSSRYWEGMPLNFPTAYKLNAFYGYDPLIEMQPDFEDLDEWVKRDLLERLPEFGVRYVVWLNDFSTPRLGIYVGAWELESLTHLPNAKMNLMFNNTKAFYKDEEVTMSLLKGAKPLAYAVADPTRPLPLELRGDGMDVDVTGVRAGSRVMLNFYWYKDMHVWLDGKPLPIEREWLSRMTVDLPSEGRRLTVRFQPPWLKSLFAGFLIVLVGIGLGSMAERRARVA